MNFFSLPTHLYHKKELLGSEQPGDSDLWCKVIVCTPTGQKKWAMHTEEHSINELHYLTKSIVTKKGTAR